MRASVLHFDYGSHPGSKKLSHGGKCECATSRESPRPKANRRIGSMGVLSPGDWPRLAAAYPMGTVGHDGINADYKSATLARSYVVLHYIRNWAKILD
ncbi:MAG: hypothetical protein ABSG32_19495 [Terriglobia bacterium]